MKTPLLVSAVLVTAALASTPAQTLPGAPEENGVMPKTGTIYVNTLGTWPQPVNNGHLGNLGVGIANNGNVIVGWEDDAEDPSWTPLQDLKAVWTLFDSTGTPLTTDTEVTSLANPDAGSIATKFLSYFRADGSAVFGGSSWAPKIKANLFGEGLGLGASSVSLSLEVAEFVSWDDVNQGDFPTVQLLNNDGQPVGILPGVSAAYATRNPGPIRMADWEYLSDGNVVIVGESQQDQDLVTVYGGSAPGHHAIFRIVNPSGGVVKAETLVSQVPIPNEIWHGVGVTRNGFAVRFYTEAEGALIRMFDNAGNPTSTNLDLAKLTGFAFAVAGGRGEAAGFHGNGKDAYVHVASGMDLNDGLLKVWVTVLNTNGTVRYSKYVADDLELAAVDRADAAIDPDGKVIVVFSAQYDPSSPSLVLGRCFDAKGAPLGGTFYVSEIELPLTASQPSGGPRVAWRNNLVAIAWESLNDPRTFDPFSGEPMSVLALRYFSTFAPGSVESVGLTRIVPDTPLVVPANDALGNWEPYSSVLGASTFLIEGSTFAEGYDAPSPNGKQRYVVALQPTTGGPMRLAEGFYGDDGQPYSGVINASRQNGNPGRVAGDKRPGATTYMVGAETSPHVYPDIFNSDGRWDLGFNRLGDGRYGCLQTFRLDVKTLTPTPLCLLQDSAFGRLTEGTPPKNEITRYGADIVCLDNGNFLSVVEDRGHIFSPVDCVTATIFAPDGSLVKDSWVVVNSDIWANVTAFKGGFAIRAKPASGANTRVIYFFDNDGNLQGEVDQAVTGVSFDPNRGDGTRIFGHINSPYVYLTGRAVNTMVIKVAAFDSRDQQFLAIADVNEGAFTGNFDRAFGAADALDRLTVAWVSQPAGYITNQVAARVFGFDGAARKFTPLTKSFFPFINAATNNIRTYQMSVAMTTRQICVAAKGQINLDNQPGLGPVINPATGNPLWELNFFTVFTHPAPAADPTLPVGGVLKFTKVQLVPGKTPLLRLEWTGGGTLEGTDNLAAGPWQELPGASPLDLPLDRAKRFFRTKE